MKTYVPKWQSELGWNPGFKDIELFYQADPNGFLMGYEKDEPVSHISAIMLNKNFSFIGLFIVKPEHRGKGYGFKLFKNALKYLEGRNIGLDSFLNMV